MTHIHLVPQETAGYLWAHILLLYTLPVLSLVVAALFAVLLRPDYTIRLMAAGIGFALLWVGLFVWINWPLQEQYHQYVPTTIKVAQIGNRFVAADHGSNQRFVFLDTDGVPYAVDDTRASLVHTGQTVTLMCVREWQQNGVPGYACNWGEMGNNG